MRECVSGQSGSMNNILLVSTDRASRELHYLLVLRIPPDLCNSDTRDREAFLGIYARLKFQTCQFRAARFNVKSINSSQADHKGAFAA